LQGLTNQMFSLVSRTFQNGIVPCLKIEGETACTIDPVYGISRNRVNGELTKSLIRINGINGADYTEVIKKLPELGPRKTKYLTAPGMKCM